MAVMALIYRLCDVKRVAGRAVIKNHGLPPFVIILFRTFTSIGHDANFHFFVIRRLVIRRRQLLPTIV